MLSFLESLQAFSDTKNIRKYMLTNKKTAKKLCLVDFELNL